MTHAARTPHARRTGVATALSTAAALACGLPAAASAPGPDVPQTPPEAPHVVAPHTEPPDAPPALDAPDLPTGDTLWDRWQRRKLSLHERTGTTIALSVESLWRGAVAGADRRGRAVLRYDLLVAQDVGDFARISLDLRGGFGDGLDEDIGVFLNTNERAEPNSHLYVHHLFYEHRLADDQITLRVGKFQIGDWIDTNRLGFLNFIAGGAAHSTTIPLVGNTLGAMATYEPAAAEWFYVSAGASNAGQTQYEAGFSSAFSGDPQWLVVGEIGLRPRLLGRDGTYRFIAWHSDAEFADDAGQVESDAAGFTLSFDQDITERVGLFARFGLADGDAFAPERSYQAGILVREPVRGRTDDRLGLTLVATEFDGSRDETEVYVELHYDMLLTPWSRLQPFAQIIANPGGRSEDTIVALGAQLTFRF